MRGAFVCLYGSALALGLLTFYVSYVQYAEIPTFFPFVETSGSVRVTYVLVSQVSVSFPEMVQCILLVAAAPARIICSWVYILQRGVGSRYTRYQGRGSSSTPNAITPPPLLPADGCSSFFM